MDQEMYQFGDIDNHLKAANLCRDFVKLLMLLPHLGIELPQNIPSEFQLKTSWHLRLKQLVKRFLSLAVEELEKTVKKLVLVVLLSIEVSKHAGLVTNHNKKLIPL